MIRRDASDYRNALQPDHTTNSFEESMSTMNNKWKRLAIAMAIGAGSVGAWEGGSALVQNVQFAHAEQQVASSREQLQSVQDLSSVFRNVGRVIEPTVVQIEVTRTIKGHRRMMPSPDDNFFRRFFRDQQMPGDPNDNSNNGNGGGDDSQNASPDDGGDLHETGTGSGVVMEVDGDDAYILTNNHVAGGATKMIVTLNDGRTIDNGTTLGADPKSDLAVVKIHAPHLIAAQWGDSDQLERGDWVLAFGSPFRYIGSMTHGIVSAIHRTDVGIISQGYENFIQVDAPINPGNSGGPLVNIHGEVVGINTAIASQSGGFQGIGFAIPSDQAKRVYAQLKEHGKVVRGWLGIGIENVSLHPEMAKESGFSGDSGVLVTEVYQGTPAYGKMQPGDVITAINGKPVANRDDLRNTVASIAPNTATTFSVFHDGKQQDVSVTLGTQPADLDALASGQAGPGSNDNGGDANADAEAAVARIGLRLSDVSDDLAEKYGLHDARQGALVTAVNPASPAAAAGIRPGDLITRVNGHRVDNAQDAQDQIAKQDLNKGFRLLITNRAGSGLRFLQNSR
jgi:serine protease Do